MSIEETRQRLEAIDKKMQNEKSKKYYYEHREQVLARMKKYAAEHPERRRENARKYHQTANHAEAMIRYWTKKLEERRKQENEHTTN